MRMQNNVWKKGLVVAVILLFIGLISTPISVSEAETKTKDNITKDFGFFRLNGEIMLYYNVSELQEGLTPLGGYRLLHIYVQYVVRGFFAKQLVPFIKMKWSHMPIELSVKDVPEWADVIIAPDVVYPEIDTQWKTDGALLFISVLNTTAPANDIFYIQLGLEPKYEYLRGPFGIIPWIHTQNITEEIPFFVKYYPLISVAPENESIEVPPGEVVELPITIKNLGNDKTVISIDKLEYPDDWAVNIVSNIVLDVNQESKVPLSIRSPQNFTGNQTIRLAFTPSYYGWPEYQGVTEFISILAYYNP